MEPSPEVENLLKQARVLRDVGRMRESLPLLKRALATAPFDADMLCQLSLAYSEIGEWGECLAAADKALSTNPISDWAHRLRSTSLRALKRNDESLQAARDAARYRPDHSFVLATLGYALLACKQVDETEAIGLRMVEVAPENVKAQLLLAEVYALKQIWVKVELHARAALQIQAESAEAYRWLGNALAEQQQHWKAIEAYVAALRLKPTDRALRTAFQNQCLQIGLRKLPLNAIIVGMFVLAWMPHQWMLGYMMDFFASANCATLLVAILAYHVPVLLLQSQPQYRQLPATTRRLVA